VLGDNFSKELTELVEPASLEKKYGGLLDDKVDNFFPPDLK
jgi:hypothetical protein